MRPLTIFFVLFFSFTSQAASIAEAIAEYSKRDVNIRHARNALDLLREVRAELEGKPAPTPEDREQLFEAKRWISKVLYYIGDNTSGNRNKRPFFKEGYELMAAALKEHRELDLEELPKTPWLEPDKPKPADVVSAVEDMAKRFKDKDIPNITDALYHHAINISAFGKAHRVPRTRLIPVARNSFWLSMALDEDANNFGAYRVMGWIIFQGRIKVPQAAERLQTAYENTLVPGLAGGARLSKSASCNFFYAQVLAKDGKVGMAKRLLQELIDVDPVALDPENVAETNAKKVEARKVLSTL